ncbi:MAG: RdgB/HAM1 family non-canonical purine NTP pyrophosphatase [Bacteroidota bacterium]|nr:RdgB/HAM1 family non-canonical purine NTP pyrophosphatase [Candidatus Kapabacteria bacterium]MCS7301935.1 RdgB/HAM1 family non-canonical purine NTP pyrophosphatase [Candidatus Kapabacteria bacterium]MCX7936609.1 RdgB/HAM1 family non-canonical purine NTP pyrophosphatase [Chlorobiota bacterium]MDW8074802.1 RdgB/HAM1 family non-canonical purine NTP pyrophosphatase [Bacteroidota bacterium]MDW8271441.1 RdgB/HAM1 family non-canonical purine NTP pyrophosphatase [Bacteroidota bacterium]
MKLVLATANPAKAHELEEILCALLPEKDMQVIAAQTLLGSDWQVEETGATLEENAYLKATAVFEKTLLPTIADDTGLEVEALGGLPGVQTARFAGENATASQNIALLLEKLSGISTREAQFRTVICYRDRFRTLFAEGVCRGSIADQPRGTEGFGYDPIFIPEGDHRTFAEMSPQEKHLRSHRRRALDSLVEQLRRLWE